jgi:hypothetical protein
MTSEEIRNKDDIYTDTFWLSEIALQLAIMNEREAAKGIAWPNLIPSGIPANQSNPFSIPYTNSNLGQDPGR